MPFAPSLAFCASTSIGSPMRAAPKSLIHSFLRFIALALMADVAAQAQTTVQIHDIMAALPASPYLGKSVSVSGIVVGVMNTGGFYFSEPSGSWDSLVATAEGMPVFYASAALNPACAAVGNIVTVVGTVTNTTTLTAANTPGTGITPTSCTVTGTGTMTQAINLSSVLTTFGDALKYTGMAASNTSFYAVAPTSGNLSESTATATSTGQFWATLGSNTATNNHLFRVAGIAGDEYKPAAAPSTVTTWGGNPQRILIDTATFGGNAVNLTVGQAITCSVPSGITLGATAGIGLIDYTLGYSRLLIFKSSVCTVSGIIAPTTSAAADATHFHVGTLDLSHFYSPAGPVAETAGAYAGRIAKAANAIVNSLGKPDILSLQEVQDLATLTDLSTATNTLGGMTYTPYLTAGNDPNSLNLGFLVNSATVVTDSVSQVEKGSTYATTVGGSALLWERPPLVLKAEFVRVGKNYPVTIINVHLTPREGIDDATLGPDIRAHRAAQATDLSALIQSYQAAGANVIVAGNFNAFEYNDGYVDVLGIVEGTPAAATSVTLYQPTGTTAALTDFTTSVPATSRYNFIERGNSESIEHILASATVPDTSTASASLASYVSAVTQPHFSTDFAATQANDTTTSAGLTPHDGFVVAFLIPPVPTTASISSSAIDFGSVDLGGSATRTVTVTNTTTFASTVNVTNITISGANASDFSQTSPCTSLAQGASCVVTLTLAPTAIGTRSGLLTVTNDSTSNPSLTATLTGIGLDTTATLTPASAVFGSVYAGGGLSAAKTFTVTNTSLIAISIKGITVSGNFNETTTCGATLAAGASCTISVVFAPLSSGALTGTLTVTNSSTANPILTSALTGTGLPTTATLTPATANYSNVIVGVTSGAQAFTWSNTSSIPLTISKISTLGDFNVSATTCSGVIAANSSCTVSVIFLPTALGARTGSVSVVSTSSANATLTATLTGRGVADVEASVALLSFGNVDVGTASTAQTITLTNYTAASIALTSFAITGDYSYTTTCGSSISGLSTCAVTLIFKPTAVGVRPGTLTVNTNDTKYPVITVGLTGNGVDFAISVLPTSGATIAGEGVSVALTLTPLGGFSAPVTLNCTTTAAGSTCIPALSTLTLSAVSTMAMPITTTSQYTVVGYGEIGGSGPPWLILLSLLSAAGILFHARRSRRLPRLATVLLALGLFSLPNLGCSGRTPDKNSAPTYPGTYTYTVSATDGILTHTATYTLSVTVR
jgi:hypothetical protein